MRQVPMTNVRDFARFKAEHRKISIVTAYDAWSARLVERSNVDAILVGDSAAMVMHGHRTTVPATVAMMALHTAAVARAAGNKFLIADLPFLANRNGVSSAIRAVGALLRSGAHAVKLEGVDGHEDVIRQIVGSGVPVMGHVGLTPQSVNEFGGFRVQGRDTADAEKIAREAHALEELGVSRSCSNAFRHRSPAHHLGTCDSNDWHRGRSVYGRSGSGPAGLWGVSGDGAPRFVRRYVDGDAMLTDALDRYDADVKGSRFPNAEESYS